MVERVWTEPAAPVTGQPIRIVSRVSNRGQQATPGGVKIRVGYALDGQLATWGEINGPLAAGASVEVPHAGPGATAGAVGAHVIVAIVDVVGLIGESNERNNQRLIQVAVTPPPPPAPPPPPTSVDLDANRLAALHQLDRRFRLASEDPGP